MRLKVAGENVPESLAIALNVAPVTIVDTHMAFIRARAIMVATRLGIFDALAGGPLDAPAVAQACHTAPVPTRHLLNALAGAGYLEYGNDRFSLGAVPRKWLLAHSSTSVRDKVLFEFFEWSIVEGLEQFVTSGTPRDLHHEMADEAWGPYQRAMRALSGLVAPEVVRRATVPQGATAMLDIGGSHGYISVAMCRKHPQLKAVILDLPSAVQHAAPILAKEQLGDRVVHRPGNARTDDLGEAAWDFIYISQLLHHFDADTNAGLMRRVARALRPRGVVAVLEMIRPETPRAAGQVGALLDLYFALTSESGTWSIEDIARWQREAGLTTMRPVRLRTAPGAALVMGTRNGA